MDRVCDEVLQLIFFELSDPGPLTHVSKRFHAFSQDSYIRAHYFLTRYGPIEALYFAFARGRVVTEPVVDILLESGAHMSRYLVQIAIHHYFHTHNHFIKGTWVRSVPLRVFLHFLSIAQRRYGEIPRAKNDDDGSLFALFLKESRFPSEMKSVSWETIKDILETYKFMPLCNKDPIMSRLPLALAVEPRLLPYAVANGFCMDSKYRDFVFRKMFERPLPFTETNPEEIAQNVRELCKLESSMFVTRTVASEVCMEAKVNDPGYRALKLLDRTGCLRFELSTLVRDLIKTFLKTRSITNPTVIENLRYLHADMPSDDRLVRLVMVLAIFLSSEHTYATPASIHQKLETMGLTPITRADIHEVLMNPFVEKPETVINYAKLMVAKENGTKGLSDEEILELLGEVAARCLEIGSKGRFLDKICQDHSDSELMYIIERHVLDHYQVEFDSLPCWEDDAEAASAYEAQLARDYMKFGVEDPFYTRNHKSSTGESATRGEDQYDLGIITQESLSTMIRHDEAAPSRSRRRMDLPWGTLNDSVGKMHYPPNCHDVGAWLKKRLGPKSTAAAIFMTHAVINNNETLLHQFISPNDLPTSFVPVTLKHFRILARLGKAPSLKLFRAIELGARFYNDETEYLSTDEQPLKARTKTSKFACTPTLCSPISARAPTKNKKRPRRSAAAAVLSYFVPDSDDDVTCDAIKGKSITSSAPTPAQTNEYHLRLWVNNLGELLRFEQRKHTAKKRQLEQDALAEDVPVHLAKSEFMRAMSTSLRHLRKHLNDYHKQLHPIVVPEEINTDDDDADYYYRAPRAKRRKIIEG